MQLLPNVVKTIKDLVELQRGALEVPCPLAFYKRASGQVSAGLAASHCAPMCREQF